MKGILRFVLILSLIFSTKSLGAQKRSWPGWMGDEVDSDYKHAPETAYENWRDLKYGMRIHWGVYSVLGLDASWPLVNASDEFRMVYNTLWQVFNPTEFDAEKWAELAEEAGFKYFVFTTKHADGFCMYPTRTKMRMPMRQPKQGYRDSVGNHITECFPGIGYFVEKEINYSIMDTPFKRDITGELVKAFRNRGLGVGLYYTNQDWVDPYQRFNKHNINYDSNYTLESNPAGYAKAMERQITQLKEISTWYGPILQFGFDCDLPYSLWDEVVEMIKMVRKNQPNALFRYRGLGPYGDYQTPEHWSPTRPDDPRLEKPWQSIKHLGANWAYQPNDAYKSKEWLLESLLDTVSKGGNFMIGVSPMANGRFPKETVERLLWVGKWLKVNGEAIYGTRPLGGRIMSMGYKSEPIDDDNWYWYNMKFDAKGLVASMEVLPASCDDYWNRKSPYFRGEWRVKMTNSEQILNLWPEDSKSGLTIDKIILTTDKDFSPLNNSIQKSDNFIVIEAERFITNKLNADCRWKVEQAQQGFSGSGYVVLDGDCANSGEAPCLSYKIRFKKPGSHYIWVRSRNKSSDKSKVFFGVDGQRIVGVDFEQESFTPVYNLKTPFGRDLNNNIRFTRSKDDKYLYVIVTGWRGNKVVVESIKPADNSIIVMLGDKGSLKERLLSWHYDDKLEIEIPPRLQVPNNRPCEHSWVFRIALPNEANNMKYSFVVP